MKRKHHSAHPFDAGPHRILNSGEIHGFLTGQRLKRIKQRFRHRSGDKSAPLAGGALEAREAERPGVPIEASRASTATATPQAGKSALSWRIPVGLGALLASGLIAYAQAQTPSAPTLIPGTGAVTTLAFSPDGSQIASGGWDNKVTLWNVSTTQKSSPLEEIDLRESGDLVLDLAFNRGGSRIVTGSRQDGKSGNPTVRVWDARTGAEALILKGAPSEFCHSVAFSLKGSLIAAGCFNQANANRTLHLWDELSGVELLTINGFDGPMAFSPDGTRVTGGHGYTQELKLFDTGTGKEVWTIPGKSFKGFNAVAFSPDGSQIVSGNGDGTLKLWNATTGEEEDLTLQGKHAGRVSAVAFSPDGKQIVSSSVDQTIRLWNASTGEEMKPHLKGQPGDDSAVAFSPDGTPIASGGKDGIRLFKN